jgi:hypothetical protein
MQVAPQYPNEETASEKTYSLSEFVKRAGNLYDATAPQQFLRFTLAGREVTSRYRESTMASTATMDSTEVQTMQMETTARVNVSSTLRAAAPARQHCSLSRDIDSAWGVTENLPYTVPLCVWVFPPLREQLKHNVGIRYTIHRQDVSCSADRDFFLHDSLCST